MPFQMRRLLDLKAEDLMCRDIITIPRGMSLRAAAHCLAQAGVSGAPVVNESGRCVGVLTKSDLVRFLDQRSGTCPFADPSGPCYFAEWQVQEIEALPIHQVNNYMSTDVITARPEATVGDLARSMHTNHVHRILITDSWDRVLGVVSSMDILGAVASEVEHPCPAR